MSTHVINRFPRGSIWWLKYTRRTQGSVQSKKRPVVIISNDYRGGSTVVEVLSMTSKDKSGICPDINIPVLNMKGELNYILCNQHQTVCEDELHDFIGIVPKSVMAKVDQGLMIAQGIDIRDELKMEIHNLENQMDSYIKTIGTTRQVNYLQSQLANISADLITMIRSYNDALADKKKSAKSNVSKKNGSTRTYTKWTEDKMLEFVIDYDEENNKSIVMEKYGFKDKNQMNHKYYYCKKKLHV